MTGPNLEPSQRQRNIDARRDYAGPLFFSQGFRPFFLGAALWAIAALVLWLASWLGFPFAGLYVDADWHIHEMIFGFAAAAMAGFLLTAIPNWTGRLPVRGLSLAVLALLWLAGRAAMLLEPMLGLELAAGIDSAFLVLFTAAILREIIVGRNWRNLKIVAIVAGLAVANIAFHLESLGILPATGMAMRGAVSLLVLLVSLIGGRIVPSFTRNALRQRGSTILPSGFTNTDRFTLVMTLTTGISFTMVPNSLLTAALALICSALHLERLTRWRGLHVLHEPMLWILHVAYLWIAVGFALLASNLFLDFPAQSAAIHAFTTGAFSSMILAVMTRASRGHTGRPLQADWSALVMYCAITLAAISRVAGSVFAGLIYHQIATVFWVVAFGLFVITYWSVLTGPDARKGR